MNDIGFSSYIVAFVVLLILIIGLRISRKPNITKEKSTINESISNKWALFLISIFGVWSLIQWVFGFFLPLGWGNNKGPDIILKDEHPEKFQELIELSVYLFIVLLIAYFVLCYFDRRKKKT